MSGLVQQKWAWFLALGCVLVACGAVAIFQPTLSTKALGILVGSVLVVGGAMQILQAFQLHGWPGFIRSLTVGVIQVLGGVMIYLNPFVGAVAVSIVIGVVLLLQGISQIALALKIRPRDGWGWVLGSGAVSLGTGLVLALRFKFSDIHTPGVVAGIALVFAGVSYIAISLMARRVSDNNTGL
ncbi:HdeD family acid-resistance protein [Luteimonas cucumeris]|nr:HdeD family acid-resistance protein [Luteimonas cucumeris]